MPRLYWFGARSLQLYILDNYFIGICFAFWQSYLNKRILYCSYDGIAESRSLNVRTAVLYTGSQWRDCHSSLASVSGFADKQLLPGCFEPCAVCQAMTEEPRREWHYSSPVWRPRRCLQSLALFHRIAILTHMAYSADVMPCWRSFWRRIEPTSPRELSFTAAATEVKDNFL